MSCVMIISSVEFREIHNYVKFKNKIKLKQKQKQRNSHMKCLLADTSKS